jgi:hypothetical protein
MNYNNLEERFVTPKRLSPFYNEVKIPRKLKKKVKKFCGVSWGNLTNSQRLWYYLEFSNPTYKKFLITKIIEA